MFESLLNLRVKIVYRDGNFNKAISGILKNIDEGFLEVKTEYNIVIINSSDIVSCLEVS